MFLEYEHQPSIKMKTKFELTNPTSNEPASVEVYAIIPDWIEPYFAHLLHRELPPDKVAAQQIERQAKGYTFIDNQLYKHNAFAVFQRCVLPKEGRQIQNDIHSGDCGHHASSRSLVSKAYHHGFFWLTAHTDVVDIVHRCEECQKYVHQPHMLASVLKTIPITWPFSVWCIYMVGPFKTMRGGLTHLLVAVDKFSKWAEAKPIKKLDGSTVTKFMKEVIYCYGYPHSIIIDNRTNFAEGDFARFCSVHGICLDLASVTHL
jgi:hypothetical protein